jgi:prepilin-type N-terminal cleavage/methylation domain-containing protein
MRRTGPQRGFTIIELLTVIAIIAVLTAILFPVASTVREQARATDCQSKLHQLYVSTRVYIEDEGGAPPALMGYAEMEINDPLNPGNKIRVPWQPSSGNPVLPAVQAKAGFLFPEIVRDANNFKCPDNTVSNQSAVTVGYFPINPPAQNWINPRTGAAYGWIGNFLAARGCPSDSNGVIDCFWDVNPADPVMGYLYLQPKYFYIWDSYDVGPRVDDQGRPVLSGNLPIFDRHYSPDWTGTTGINDLTTQLKYKAPPSDTTVLTWCSHHAYTARVDTVTTINLAGTARKVRAAMLNRYGANYITSTP